MAIVLRLRRPVATQQRTVVDTAAVRNVSSNKPLDSGGEALVLRVARGDQRAMSELYDLTCTMVYSLANRIVGDRNLAEDVVVEVYAQAWRQASVFDPQRGSVAAWLMTLARTRAIDFVRARRRERAVDPLESAGDVEDGRPGPETSTSEAERQRFVRSAMLELSDEQREAIELAYYGGLSHSEIADRLGQPLGTVKTRIRLGMIRMRDLLQHMSATPRALQGGPA